MLQERPPNMTGDYEFDLSIRGIGAGVAGRARGRWSVHCGWVQQAVSPELRALVNDSWHVTLVLTSRRFINQITLQDGSKWLEAHAQWTAWSGEELEPIWDHPCEEGELCWAGPEWVEVEEEPPVAPAAAAAAVGVPRRQDQVVEGEGNEDWIEAPDQDIRSDRWATPPSEDEFYEEMDWLVAFREVVEVEY